MTDNVIIIVAIIAVWICLIGWGWWYTRPMPKRKSTWFGPR